MEVDPEPIAPAFAAPPGWPLGARQRDEHGGPPAAPSMGRSPEGVTAIEPAPARDEIADADVLDMLDELAETFGQSKDDPTVEDEPVADATEPAASPAAGSEGPESTEEEVEDDRPPAPAGRPSPYLEERLEVAQRLLAGLRGEADDLARRTVGLRWALEAVGSEVTWAASEVAFAREHGLLGLAAVDAAPPESERPGARAVPSTPATPTEARAVASTDPRYRDFTVQRYNATMGAIKRRRPTVVVVSLLVAAVLSAALIAVAYASHAPEPPWWLAALPGIWMIPVPFFVLSFRGTQRILRRNHFDLPEAP